MTMQKRYAFLLLPALGVLALACCSTLTSESSCGHGAGRVVDEALCVGRSAASFPAADEDYFRDMDYGVTKNPATVAAELAPYVPGIAPGDATAAAVKGRNNWIVWAGGNDRLWNDLSVESAGIIRDRERGVPRFNEFRRQYGLRQLRSYDDFIDTRQPSGSPERTEQERLIATLRAVYGQHRCDASKVITAAQLDDRGNPITDCLGFADGTLVDNIEDVDTVVGWLAEFRRPHGIRHFRDAVAGLHSQRVAAPLQRPFFHVELPARVLFVVRRAMGHRERSRRQANGARQSEWTRDGSVPSEAGIAAQRSGVAAGARAGDQRIRSVGARPRHLLFIAMDASLRGAIGSRLPRVIAANGQSGESG